MPGGILNLISYGNQNIILNSNPTKSFFKAAYMKYTNFGLQRFRVNYEGQRNLDTINDTQYTFKIPRYGDLVMDTYLVVSLPHIWSSVYKVTNVDEFGNKKYTYIPYEFKWVEELGTHIIKNIRIRCGNSLLQEYSGEYISVCAKRDYKKEELEKFNAMSGNVPELSDPALPFLNLNPALIRGIVGYPSAFFDKTSLNGGGPEPSIRGRKLYIPLNAWFCNTSKLPFPLISSQNSELFIDITLRPLKELFVIRDVSNFYNNKLNSLSYETRTSYGSFIVNDEVIVKNPFKNPLNLSICDTNKNGLIYIVNTVDELTTERTIRTSIFSNGLIIDDFSIKIINLINTFDAITNSTSFIETTIEILKDYFFNNDNIDMPIGDIITFLIDKNILNITDPTYSINVEYVYNEYTSRGLLSGFKKLSIISFNQLMLSNNNEALVQFNQNVGNIVKNNTSRGLLSDFKKRSIVSFNEDTIINNTTIEREYISLFYNDDFSIISETIDLKSKSNIVGSNNITTTNSKTFDPPMSLQNNEYQSCFTIDFIESLNTTTNEEFLTEYPYIQPNFNLPEHAMYRFLHPPPNTDLDYINADKRVLFNSDVHLISTYAFLTEEEGYELATKTQSFLIKDVREYTFNDIVGNTKLQLTSNGLINNWTFFLRRNDHFLRNEWCNYSNWTYKYFKPQRIINTESITTLYESNNMLYDPDLIGQSLFRNGDFDSNGFFFVEPPIEYYATGPFNIQNEKKILKRFGIYLDGKIREEVFDSGIYNYIEPFHRASGKHTENLFFYNFGVDSFRGSTQPCGAINMSKFTKIELELETEIPPLDPDAQFYTVCTTLDEPQLNTNNGQRTQIIGVNKENFRLYKYTYDLRLFEEKYNIVNFTSGICGLQFTR